MPKIVWKYIHGSPEEVITRSSHRSYSNIDSPQIREAVLLPQNKPNEVYVLGALQEYHYPFISREAESDLKRLESDIDNSAQEATHTYTGFRDPYPSSLTALIYSTKRISLKDLKKQLPNDPLQRITLVEDIHTPKFSNKSKLEDPNLSSYALMFTGVQTIPWDSNQLIHQFSSQKEIFGLTRMEALQAIGLQQSASRQNPQFTASRAQFIHIFIAYNLLLQTEKELLKRRETALTT